MTLYQKHTRSMKWQRFKRRVRAARGNACESCGASGCRIEVHHVTYERLGNELPQDVRLLCVSCHAAAHLERKSA